MTESIKIDIEKIASEMMERSKAFYRDPENEHHIQRCIEYRDDLEKLLNQCCLMTGGSERVFEVTKILTDAVVDMNNKIKKLRRAH